MAKFNLAVQFLKDISFESPNVPELLVKQGNGQAKIDMPVEIKLMKAGENNLYMVDLILKVHSKLTEDEKTIFMIETTYSGLVQIDDAEMDEDAKKRILLIDVPNLLFPSIRALVTRLTAESGFPPFAMQPVDFEKKYEEKYAAANA